ncbi:hypothetical protein [Streptomyces sp. MNP-20]|uniref:hypothetical protein n=1 Tax=Streptomyces sp. MNP-20 TaxID=2721165 RepID=UPI0015558C03|nr:hypothetical protein [Streptomyces sp. MNP-20]
MASIKTYKRQSGAVTYRVVWRHGGSRSGDWQAEIFDDGETAKRFRDLVNGHGQQWPPGWVKGEGFVEPDEPECPADQLFPAYAHKSIALLADISGHTRTNYQKFIENHMTPWFRDLAVSDHANKITRDHVSQWINNPKEGRPGPHHEPGTVRRAYAPKTIANLHGLLFSILQTAVTADPPLRDSNPCAHTRLPKGDEAEDEEVFLEPEEYALLRAHLKEDAVDLVDALVGSGLRWGEATAFQPRDFTFTSKHPKLRVQRA